MLNNINYTLLLIAAVVTLNSCESKDKSAATGDDTVPVDSIKKLEDDASSKLEKTDLPVTKIQFAESSFNFGKIDEGQKVEHIFKFKNTGDQPLVLQDARASCGCTVPQYTKDPIAPGAEGEIKVIFDSAGKGGQQIEKTVTVTANTEPVTTDIKITGSVQKKIDGPYNK